MQARWLRVEPLSAGAFAGFGEVIEAREEGLHYPINEGFAERYHDLARLDTGRQGGHPLLSLFRARPRPMPLQIRRLERHRLGSQTFVPLGAQRFLVVVAPPGPAPTCQALRCFVTAVGQGVHYAAGTWHHPLIALEEGDFLVVDRGGPGAAQDCEECDLAAEGLWVTA